MCTALASAQCVPLDCGRYASCCREITVHFSNSKSAGDIHVCAYLNILYVSGYICMLRYANQQILNTNEGKTELTLLLRDLHYKWTILLFTKDNNSLINFSNSSLSVLPPSFPPALHYPLTIHTYYIVLQTASLLSSSWDLSLFPYPPDTQGASTTANGQQHGSCKDSPHRHCGPWQEHPSHLSETSYWDVCGVVMCE